MSVVNRLTCVVLVLLSILNIILIAGAQQVETDGNGGWLKSLSFSEEVAASPVLTVSMNGSMYRLNMDVCTGGVMLKRRREVDEVCGVGVFTARTSGCVSDSEMFIGLRNEYTCTRFPGGVQAILFTGNPVEESVPTTEEVITTSTESTTTTTTTSAPPTEEITITIPEPSSSSTPHYLDSIAELNSTDLLFEHNSLMEKRGVTTPDPDESVDEDILEVEITETSDSEKAVGKRGSKKDATTTKAPAQTTTKTTTTTTTTEAPEEETDSPAHDSESGEDDTLSLEETETNTTSLLTGRLDVGAARPYDVQPVQFKVVTDSSAPSSTLGNGESVEDTVPLEESVPVIEKVLSGRLNHDLFDEGPSIDFKAAEVSEVDEFSAEKDEAGGSWESGEESAEVRVPFEETLEFDALTSGIDKWVGKSTPTPLFDSHLTLLRQQIDFELVKWGSHTDEVAGSQQQSHPHVSVIGHKDLAYDAPWFRILSEVATTASSLVPDELFRDPFSVPGSRIKRDGSGVPEPSNSLFDDVLRVFGYFTRSYDGGGVEFREGVLSGIGKGFGECRAKAEGFRKGCVVGGRGSGRRVECAQRMEIKSISITRPVWNDYNATYSQVAKVLDFTSSSDMVPNEVRINPGKWIFAELMWYAVQITYMFCFESFSGVDPNSFMLAYDVILRLFESELVTGLWDEVGGNLAVFELLLPYVRGSVVGGGGDDFRFMLAQLDKVASGVRASSVVGAFGRGRKGKGRRGKVRYSWDEIKKRRRRRRDVGGVEGGRDVSSFAPPEGKGIFSQTGWFSGGGGRDTNGTYGTVEAGVPATDGGEVGSEVGGVTVTSELVGEVPTSSAVQETVTSVDTSEVPPPEVTPTTSGTTSTSTSTTTTSSTTTTTTSTTSRPTSTSTPSTTKVSSTSITSTTPPPTTPPQVDDPLRLYEIWDGLAYCLVNDEVGNLRPSYDELERGGVCRKIG